MLKSIAILLAMTPFAWAQNLEKLQEELNLVMCREINHQFDDMSKACIYCAHGLHRNEETTKCEGTPDVIGKCYGDDHYHAATQECMYCGTGFTFNEKKRKCIEMQKKEKEK